MNQHQVCGVIAGILSAAAFIPYIVSILRGKTKPSRVTWSIWVLVGVLICGSYTALGATSTAWVTFSYVIGPAVVAVLSFRRGVGGWEKLDIFCLCGVILGALLWWKFNSPLTALTINVAIDFLGLLPTIKKSWLKPREEDLLTWTVSASSAVMNLLALEKWTFALALYPVYMFIGIWSVCLILWWKWLGQKNQ